MLGVGSAVAALWSLPRLVSPGLSEIQGAGGNSWEQRVFNSTLLF